MRPKLWEDTSPAAERVLIEGYRRMLPGRKAGQVASLTLAVQQLSLARLRAESPDASEHDLRVKLAALWLPDDLLNRVLAYERARQVA